MPAETQDTNTAPASRVAKGQRADTKDRWLALYVLCVGFLMIVLDMTVVNVALPAIQDDLGFSQSGLAWVVNGYLIAFGGLLLLAGRLGDLLGRKNVFMVGMGIFLTASFVCGFAQSQAVLVGARFIQGVGGALTSAVILGMIVTMFAEPKEQAKALGVYAFVASAGGSIGLLAGGALTQAINWHWIFFINLPIGIGTSFAANRLVARDKGLGFGEGADIPGAVLITSALMLGVYTIVSPAAENGWGDPGTLGLGAVSSVLLAAFIVRQARAANPLMPLHMFRSRNVSGANVIQALTIAGMFGMFFLGSLYLKEIQGYDPLEIGLAFLPTTLAMGTMSIRFSDRLINRFGPKNVLLPGLALIGLGLAMFTRTEVDGNYASQVLPPMLLLGIGAGSSFTALMTLAMSGATQEDAGLASGLVNTTAQVGAALGLAVLATLSATRTENLVGDGTGQAQALVSGYHLAFWIGTALVGIALTVAALVLEPVEAPQGTPEDAPGAPEPGTSAANQPEPAYTA
jgi:EmrB/QacA subfamily drug resistance transporter